MLDLGTKTRALLSPSRFSHGLSYTNLNRGSRRCVSNLRENRSISKGSPGATPARLPSTIRVFARAHLCKVPPVRRVMVYGPYPQRRGGRLLDSTYTTTLLGLSLVCYVVYSLLVYSEYTRRVSGPHALGGLRGARVGNVKRRLVWSPRPGILPFSRP